MEEDLDLDWIDQDNEPSQANKQSKRKRKKKGKGQEEENPTQQDPPQQIQKEESQQDQKAEQEQKAEEETKAATGKGKKGKGKGMSAAAKKALAKKAQLEEEMRLEEEARQKAEEEAKIREEERVKREKEDAEERERQRVIDEQERQRRAEEEKEAADRAYRERIQQNFAKQSNIIIPGQSAQHMKKRKDRKKKQEEEEVKEEDEVEEEQQNEEDEEIPLFEDWENEQEAVKPEQKVLTKKEKKALLAEQESESEEEEESIRAPILCILGHVDTGKTKLLDKIRRTNVQGGEAGGITQQIGATWFPDKCIDEQIRKLPERIERLIPGLLVIDTPGHESFTNLRSRGSNLCDIAILVIDLMHGLENQTRESLQLLKNRGTPFIVALNKIDRCYEWNQKPYGCSKEQVTKQNSDTQSEFYTRTTQVILQLNELGYNACLYWENDSPEDTISLIPTSAITGEGIPDLLGQITLITQERLHQTLVQVNDEFSANVMEVKVTEGLGHTIDVILISGELHESDTIVMAGLLGPIVTSIKAILTPQPMQELRIKSEYIHHKSIKAAIGIKIAGQGNDLEKAIAGSPLFVPETEEEIEECKEEAQREVESILQKIKITNEGIHLQASTLGSLEALLDFFNSANIPISGVSIGPVHKSDVLQVQNQIEAGHRREYATILAFDVKVTVEASEYATKIGVMIFTADIIYHLWDQFIEYQKKIKIEDQQDPSKGQLAVFPCVLKIVESIHKKNPLIMGLEVKAGILKLGTPLCVPDKNNLYIGKVQSIEKNNKSLVEASSQEGSVGVRMNWDLPGQKAVALGTDFEQRNEVCSKISRQSIDAMKLYFRDEMEQHKKLIVALKKVLGVI